MRWKLFIQIGLLMLLAAGLFLKVYPRYRFVSWEGIPEYRCDSISGTIEYVGEEQQQTVSAGLRTSGR